MIQAMIKDLKAMYIILYQNSNNNPNQEHSLHLISTLWKKQRCVNIFKYSLNKKEDLFSIVKYMISDAHIYYLKMLKAVFSERTHQKKISFI